jgi:hypothetical protein
MEMTMRVLLGVLVAGLLIACSVTHASAQANGISPRSALLQWPPTAGFQSQAAGTELVQPALHPTILPVGSGSDRRTGRALMIVGAAGIVTGLIVDESIVTIAGAGVGGYGLYLYLR